ncbi:MAG: DNA polymerase III subunit alpha [Pseudomonadota bacterium]
MPDHTPQFVHLRLHTQYSLQDGIVRVPQLLKTASEFGMHALAVTDHSNMFGLVKFYKKARQAGIKPIVATDVCLFEDGEPFLLSLYAMNLSGYQNIRRLLSRAYQDNQIQGQAYVKREWLNEHNDGLLVLSGAKFGDVGKLLLQEKKEEAGTALTSWMTMFPDRFYLELQRTGRVQDEQYLHAAVALAQSHDCPVVASNDVRFMQANEFEAHEARVCIYESRTLNDPRRERKYSSEQYFKTADEMVELFSDIPEAIENTVEISKRCSVEIELGKHYLPDFPIPDGMTLEEFFREVCHKGLKNRFAKDIRLESGESPREEQQYWDRLEFEIDIILQMGFPGYFLIVMDFIHWAKEQDIPVGPGRGSGAGSLVAYALDITDLDPLQYDLLFERFLNPERVSMPDFDIDFCQERRDEVIQYVADTYGKNAVSQIITFGTMAAKAVVRDVARVQGKPYGLADKLSKMIPFAIGMTLEKAYETEPDIASFLRDDADAQGIWDMALLLEGIVRNVGKHAAGVVIAPSQLSDFTPVYCVEGESVLVSQFDKDDVEDVGLVKFDFLGLKNLTIIQWALRILNETDEVKSRGAPIDITQIPLDDTEVFEQLQTAQTTAVFQLESSGMKDLIERLKPSTFEDIIALVALYRPGPLESGMVDDFISRKHGKQELSYPHPQFQHDCLIPALKPTYGVILYQEQVMQIAQVMGGYSLGSADMLRRAMGKKKPEEMAKQREMFVAGSIENGFDETLASNIFDLMEKFAGYGFNKSHSAAYALVAYQTAWLKTHYPSAFMAAVMSADLQNTDKIVTLIEECRHMNIDILPPDINQGQYLFTVDKQGRIIYGLGALKGLGEGPVECLIDERGANGEFSDLFDLCARTDSRKLNKRSLEAIIRSGSMDSLGEARSLLMHSLQEAMQAAEQKSSNASAGIADMFGDIVSSSTNANDVYERFRHEEKWNLKYTLQGEKDTLGLYLTGHPIDAYEQEIARLSNTRIANLSAGNSLCILGLVISIRIIKTKRGANMAIVLLDDRSGRTEIALFSEMYDRYRDILHADALLIVEGKAEEDRYTGGLKLNVQTISSIEQARLAKLNSIQLILPESTWREEAFVDELRDVISPFKWVPSPYTSHIGAEQDSVSELPASVTKSGVLIELLCQMNDTQVTVQLGAEWRVSPKDELIDQLTLRLSNDSVFLNYI